MEAYVKQSREGQFFIFFHLPIFCLYATGNTDLHHHVKEQ
jgi:hypothetical protein